MANWLDDLERKKKEEDERFRAKLAADVKRYEAEREANDKLYASLKPSFDPIFSKVEMLVQRANKNDFFLIAQRGQYSHELKIFRYNAEQSRVDVKRGELQMWTEVERAKGNEQYLKGVAQITLYPKPEGIQIWFTETDISMGWKGGKWYDKWQFSGQAKLHECVGTVPYGSLSEDKLLELVKWISTGKELLPSFTNAIPYKSWEPPRHETRGCLYSPWTYIIPIGLIVIVIYINSGGNRNIVPTQANPASGQIIGTMRSVRAVQLNMRSGPGNTYPVVRVFSKSERIVSFGDPQSVNGESWIQASTPDGQVRGWVNRKFIEP